MEVLNKLMDAAAELGRNPVSKHQIQPSMEMSRLTPDGTAEPVSRDQIIPMRERGQGNVNFPILTRLILTLLYVVVVVVVFSH